MFPGATLASAQLALIFRAALPQTDAVGLWSSSAGRQTGCGTAWLFQSTRKLCSFLVLKDVSFLVMGSFSIHLLSSSLPDFSLFWMFFCLSYLTVLMFIYFLLWECDGFLAKVLSLALKESKLGRPYWPPLRQMDSSSSCLCSRPSLRLCCYHLISHWNLSALSLLCIIKWVWLARECMGQKGADQSLPE